VDLSNATINLSIATNRRVKHVTHDQRVTGKTPRLHFGAKVMLEIADPGDFAVLNAQTLKVTFAAENVNSVGVDLGPTSRTVPVANGVCTFVGMLPELLTRFSSRTSNRS